MARSKAGASTRTIDFRGVGKDESAKPRNYEPGEHRGCKFVDEYHFHVSKVGGKAELGSGNRVQKKTGGPAVD